MKTQEDELNLLTDLATKICGLDKGWEKKKTRKREYQLPRTIISNIARIDKAIHYNVISKVLNRDRTSIYYYERIHKGNYQSWGSYRLLFNKIYNAYNDIKFNKKKFMLADDMKSYLISQGLKESLNPSVFITLESDKQHLIIKTDYRNFSDQLEIIRLALVDYDYKHSIEIK